MNDMPRGFRSAALVVALVLGCYSLATLFAETFTPKVRSTFLNLAVSPKSSTEQSALVGWLAAIAPLRGDLLANAAFAYSGPITKITNSPNASEGAENSDRALSLATRSLSFSPYASDVWLLLAALQRKEVNSKSAVEALKMSYLTSPGDASLIPARLLVLSTSHALNDVELQNLARGDIRLILTRRADLRPAILAAYRQGTLEAKAYLADTVRSLDFNFVSTLQ